MWMMFSHAALPAFRPPVFKWLEMGAKPLCRDVCTLSHPRSRSLDVSVPQGNPFAEGHLSRLVTTKAQVLLRPRLQAARPR